jgi:hypothetical protein
MVVSIILIDDAIRLVSYEKLGKVIAKHVPRKLEVSSHLVKLLLAGKLMGLYRLSAGHTDGVLGGVGWVTAPFAIVALLHAPYHSYCSHVCKPIPKFFLSP